MKSGDYQTALSQAYTLAALILGIDFGGALAAIEHAETFGPILDPTAFIRNGKKLAEDKAIVAILARAKRDLDKLAQSEPSNRPRSVEQADARTDCAGGETFDGDPARIVDGQGVA